MLIGMAGKLGSGKDTAAEHLRALVDLPSERRAFADPLKESAAACIRVSREFLERNKNNPDTRIIISESPPTGEIGYAGMGSFSVREYLQWFGTEGHREVFGDNFWVDATLPLDLDHADKLIVITDVRFPNELDRVQALGGLVIQVRGEDEETGGHASEQVLEGCDYEIDNSVRDDDFANLDSQLRMFVYSMFGGSLLAATYSGLEAA